MNKTVSIVTVYVEKDAISCECVCPVAGVEVGDFVQIFLNNAPTTGEVKEKKEVLITDLPNSIYDMKSVIRKVPNPANVQAAKMNTLRVNELINRNRTVTLIGRGVLGHFDLSNAELEAHHAEVGDTIYFSETDGTLFVATILQMKDTANTYEPRIHVNAAIKSEKNKEFLKNKISIDTSADDKRATLTSYTLPHAEYVIDDIVTHIGMRAFERCRKLKSLTIATDGVVIEPLAFAYNNSIEEINIVDERAEIAVNSFDGCSKLRRVTLPYMLYSLRYELAEYYGDRIEFIYVLGSNHLIDGVVYSPKMKAVICCIDEDIVEYRAPVSVETIHCEAFLNCRKLQTFVASPLTDTIGCGLFDGCMALKDVHLRYENKASLTFMFGTKYCENARTEDVQFTDGTTKTYYIPRHCTYHNMPKTEDLLRDIDPSTLSPLACHYLGEYFSEKHNVKEAVRFHALAARQGIDESYQRLAAYSQIEGIDQQYFTVELYDYANRLLTVKPFFRMLENELPEYHYGDVPDEDILEQFMDPEELKKLLQDISKCSIFDTDLLNIGLNKIFIYTEEIHNLEIKRLFLRCVQKIGQFDNIIDWKEELLDALFENGAEEDYREFGFEIITLTDFLQKPEKEEFLESMPESETKICLQRAHDASMLPRKENVEIFEAFLKKYDETGDVFYQKCAVVALNSYLAFCWREKAMSAQFRSLLGLVQKKYDEGYDLLGKFLLSFKQNLKRSIPKRYFFECAEKLYDAGLLHDNSFNNIIGKNVQEKAAYYFRYPEYFNPKDKDTFVMKEFNSTWVYVPGTMVMKLESSKKTPLMYTHYTPELVDGELVLFLNPHEGITYAKKKGVPLPEDYFAIPLGQVLSVMSFYNLTEARVFPRILNKTITAQYIKSVYDWR